MNAGYPRLLGDIGGTNARWAWQPEAGALPHDVQVFPCRANASILDSANHYLAATGHTRPIAAAIGIATTINGDQVQMLNHSWSFSIAQFEAALGVQHCLVMNDFTALAMSLPALTASDVRVIGGGHALAKAPIALLGPGTGLGVSGLIADHRGRFTALSGEGGHVSLAAADEFEAALITLLQKQFGHASAERALSGPGLVNLYEALCKLEGIPARALTPAGVSQAAIAKTDAECERAVQVFASLLGSVAGNLALTLGATGGLYVGGGVVPQLGAAFDADLFRSRFEAKGRFESYLSAIPTAIITAANPALIGASRALDCAP